MNPDSGDWPDSTRPSLNPERKKTALVGLSSRSDRWDRIGRLALFASIFFSGYSLLRFGEINLTLADVAFFSALLIFGTKSQLNTQPFGLLAPLWLFGLILMLGGLFISTVINGDIVRWIIVAGQYLFAFLLIPMVLMGQPANVTQRLTVFYVFGIALSQVIGIGATFFYSYQDTVGLMGDGFITGNGRLGAMAGEPNPNGATIAFALPMLVYIVRKRMISPLLGIICIIPLVWGLLASASFTGFAASLIALCLVMTASGFRVFARLAALLVVAGTTFVAIDVPLPDTFVERVGGAVATGNLSQAGTFVDRSSLIKEAWELAAENLVIGVGVDRYREISDHGAPVHELHLLIWNEGGIIAFIGLLTLLGTLVYLAFAAIFKSRSEGAMIVAVVAVFMVYTVSIPHMYSRQWIMPVMLALSTVYFRRPSVPANQLRSPLL